jgi:hypothetical protein
MVGRRIDKSIQRGQPLEIEVDGKKIVAYKGETIATALIAAGLRTKMNLAACSAGLVCASIAGW